jgi:hypothetical protein
MVTCVLGHVERNYDSFIWAFDRLTKYDNLSIPSLIRYINNSGEMSAFVTICKLGIIKRKDMYSRYIFHRVEMCCDFEVIKWIIDNDYVPDDVITIGTVTGFVLDPWKTSLNRLNIAKCLYNHIKDRIDLYNPVIHSNTNNFVLAMYCLDPEYAKTLKFGTVTIDQNQLLLVLPKCKNVNDLLKVARLNAPNLGCSLHTLIPSEDTSLLEFAFAQTGLTIDYIRTHGPKLFIYMCICQSKGAARFFYQQGMRWTDINRKSTDHTVQWFLSVTNQD